MLAEEAAERSTTSSKRLKEYTEVKSVLEDKGADSKRASFNKANQAGRARKSPSPTTSLEHGDTIPLERGQWNDLHLIAQTSDKIRRNRVQVL
jgi:hypothetical protein